MKRSELKRIIREELSALNEDKRDAKALKSMVDASNALLKVERPFANAYNRFMFRQGENQDLSRTSMQSRLLTRN